MMISDGLEEFDIILVSSSPRRRQLMEEAGFRFRVADTGYNESSPVSLNGRDTAEYLAAAKADAWSEALLPGQIIITADTVVLCGGKLLGKPADEKEAMGFLRQLSACRHEVITGICLRSRERRKVFSVTTAITFRELAEQEIDYYVQNYKPFDKAGAYGIQEWIGLRGITTVEGSYYNVMGLPVSDLYAALLEFTGLKPN